jgi:DNA-binding MarR family transcriptional regulator
MAVARHRAAMARKLGLSDSEVLAVAHLAQHGELSQTRLAGLLDLSSGGTAALVQRLERDGHVTRRGTDDDKRLRLVRLTPGTVRRAAEFYGPLVADIDALLERSSDDEDAITRFLDALASITEQHADRVWRGATADETVVASLTPGLWG